MAGKSLKLPDCSSATMAPLAAPKRKSGLFRQFPAVSFFEQLMRALMKRRHW
jgi:hypothetical protein